MSYKGSAVPARPPVRYETHHGGFQDWLKSRTPEVGRAYMAEIRATLAGNKGGYVAGTWQHVTGNTGCDSKEWARVLKVRHECGEHLLPIQIEFYRAALA